MSKMIQIRNVPDSLHRKLKARAAEAGKSLSDYLLAEIGRIAALPTREEMLARIHSRSRVDLKVPAADVIRRERAAEAIEDLTLFHILRHPHLDLLGRAWELRENVAAYDAMYLALAEALDAPLVTCDGPLGAAPGHATRVEVIR
jgi:predicted nucleic acid-binding protein